MQRTSERGSPAYALPRSLELIRQLVQFDTTSRNSNLALIDWVGQYLTSHGLAWRLTHDDTGAKANLFCTIGDPRRPGIVLSGHTDVVPIDAQPWSVDPWAAVISGERLVGRGTADMKAFLGIVLAAVPDMLARPLAAPIHLAFSYDEEVGCIGVGRMIRDLQSIGVAPGICIVGEPTGMKVVTGHKGKLALRAHVCGREAHSALAPYAVNALEYAAEIIVELRRMQREAVQSGPFSREYDPPYSTLHTGVLHGGTALNIVPRECTFDFEFRTVPGDDPHRLLARLRAYCANELVPQMQRVAPESRIDFETKSDNPGLHTEETAEIVGRIERLARGGRGGKVAFASEAGQFQRAGFDAVICGPGFITDAHKPDEFITFDQIRQGEAFIARVVEEAQQGAGAG
ncbi:MAG TPA: acetylornithine deacetylase [Casimicrobiaceae bacterium]|nr:acetylornithine deacetylase [Casimicrobiaceae bacterium]